MYISDRFPFVATKNEALVTRLGEANARRRQYFKYCRDHNDRLSGPHMKEGAARKQGSQAHPAPQPADPGPATRSVVSGQTKPSLLADTEATEFLAQPSDNAGLFEQLDAQSAPSMVSFATSVAEVSEDNFFFPPLPSEAENNSTFLCPYCCTVVEFKKRDRTRQWRRHVLEDLEPYICTFSGCGLETYQTQQAWFDHELLVHRSIWACPKCSASFESSKSLEQHIIGHHGHDVTANQIAAVTEMARRRPESILPSECPFCDSSWASAEPDAMPTGEAVVVVDVDQFRKHLGHHLQQIALFSLPRLNQEQEMGSNAAEFAPDQDTISLPHEFGRGWSLIFSNRGTLAALASFLTLRLSQQNQKFLLSNPNLLAVDLDNVPRDLKKVGEGWSVVARSESSPALGVKLLRTLAHSTAVADVRFSADGEHVATACFGSVNVYNVDTGARHRKLTLPGGRSEGVQYFSIWFSPDSKRIVSGDDTNMVIVWSVEDGAVVQTFAGHTGAVNSVCWVPDGQSIVSGGEDGELRAWDVETADCPFSLPTDPLDSVAVSPDSQFLVWITRDGLTGICDLRGSSVEAWSGATIWWGRISALDFIYDEPGLHHHRFITVAPDNIIRLFGKLDSSFKPDTIWEFEGHEAEINGVTVVPFSRWFLSASADGCVVIWDWKTGLATGVLRTGQRIRAITGVSRASGYIFATTGKHEGVGIWAFPMDQYAVVDEQH